tara:strand:- start:2151 stop:2867 length:717 start_codon:yes stop_codon:yes gene_type:complete
MNRLVAAAIAIIVAFFLLLCTYSNASANDIYIQQVGDTLDLDIVQDGANNVIGTSSQDVVLTGDTMTFNITQTGASNTIAAQILGSTYTGTWVFTGSSNTVDLLCSSSATGDCDTVTLNIAATGSSQNYTLKIGETADASNSTVVFTVTDDGTVITTDVDGQSANVNVTINKNSSAVSTVNTLDIDITGDGDVGGHDVTLDIKGRGNTTVINQSGINDNKIDLHTNGDNGNVNITQSD